MANLLGGGAERVTVNIIKQLDKEKFDISLVMVSLEGVFLNEIPSHVKIINLNAKKTLYSIFKFRSIIKKIKPDIIYSTLFHTSIAQYIALFNVKDRPKIILRNPTSPKLLFQEGGLGFLWKFLLKKAYKSADKILAQTPEMQDEISYYYDIKQKYVDIFINPLDTNGIDHKVNNIANPFDDEKINVVAAGRLTQAKAFDTLLYAFKEVIEKNNKFILHIIGRDDGEKETLLALQKNLGLEKNVNFLGFQDNPYRFFYFSDLFVLSSRREGLPNAVLENLYLKKPVIATRCIPFMSKIINSGKNGYIVDVDDITGLSMAIINYKTLDELGTCKSFNPSSPNKYFLELG